MKKTYRIEGLDCANCAAKIEGMISKLDGVNSCTINFITGKIIIDADDEKFETVLKEAAHVCRKVERDAEIIVKQRTDDKLLLKKIRLPQTVHER